jgi:hypothetical protein
VEIAVVEMEVAVAEQVVVQEAVPVEPVAEMVVLPRLPLHLMIHPLVLNREIVRKIQVYLLAQEVLEEFVTSHVILILIVRMAIIVQASRAHAELLPALMIIRVDVTILLPQQHVINTVLEEMTVHQVIVMGPPAEIFRAQLMLLVCVATPLPQRYHPALPPHQQVPQFLPIR